MRVVAVASAQGRSARALAGEAGGRRVDVVDLPADADVMVVATPIDTHLSLAISGARGGALVLVESPWWTDCAEANAAMAVDHAGPGRIRGAANLRSSPLWRQLLAERSEFGSPTHISGAVTQPLPQWGHLSEGTPHRSPVRQLGAPAVTCALDLIDPDWPATCSVRASRNGADVRIEIITDVVRADLTLTHGNAASVWFQAASDEGVLRVEFSPAAALERNGVDVLGQAPSGDASIAVLRDAGYVDQLARLGAEDDLTLDPEQMAFVTSLLDAAETSAASDGRLVTP